MPERGRRFQRAVNIRIIKKRQGAGVFNGRVQLEVVSAGILGVVQLIAAVLLRVDLDLPDRAESCCDPRCQSVVEIAFQAEGVALECCASKRAA